MEESLVEWASRCLFQCRYCKDFRSEMRKHVHRHMEKCGKRIKENGTKNKPHFVEVVKKVLHTCKICKVEVSWDHHSLYRHFPKVHKSTLNDYFKNHIQGTAEDIDDNREDFTGDDQDGENNNRDFIEWASKCKYQCKICKGFVLNRAVAFRKHVYNVHKINVVEYKSRHGNPMVKNMRHQCRICSRSIQWEYETMQVHMKQLHRSTIQIYFDKYFRGNSKELKDPGSPPKKSATKWASKCTFKCKECGHFKTNQRHQLLTHLESHHGSDVAQYKKKFGDLMTQKVLHKCKICGARLLWNYSNMVSHCESIHKITLSDYHRKHLSTKWLKRNRCLLCKSFRAPKAESLRNHIIGHHKMRMRDYIFYFVK